MGGCGVGLPDLTGDQNGSTIGYAMKTRGTVLLQLAGESFTTGTLSVCSSIRNCSLVIIITTRTPTRLSAILLFMSLTTISTSWVNLHPSIFRITYGYPHITISAEANQTTFCRVGKSSTIGNGTVSVSRPTNGSWNRLVTKKLTAVPVFVQSSISNCSVALSRLSPF